MWRRTLKITWSRGKHLLNTTKKPVKIDDFNDEEKKIVEMQVKKKKKRREVAEKNKTLKRKKKAEKEKIGEVGLWERPKTINKDIKKIDDAKKNTKKISKTVLNNL